MFIQRFHNKQNVTQAEYSSLISEFSFSHTGCLSKTKEPRLPYKVLVIFYVITQSLRHEQDVTQGQFLSGVQLPWIPSFPSPRLVALPWPKNLVWPNIYTYLEVRKDGFMPLSWVFAQSETPSTSSRIWTWVNDSIPYHCNSLSFFLSLSLSLSLSLYIYIYMLIISAFLFVRLRALFSCKNDQSYWRNFWQDDSQDLCLWHSISEIVIWSRLSSTEVKPQKFLALNIES